MKLPATANGSSSGSSSADGRAASARAPCRSAPATPAAACVAAPRSRSCPGASGPSWISRSDECRYRATKRAELRLESSRGRCRRAGRRRESMSIDSARNGASSRQNASRSSSRSSRVVRLDLADHPEVEEVDLAVPPLACCPGCGSAWKKPSVEDLPVVRLEQLPRGLLALGPLGRLADRDALDLLHHEQPRGRELAVDARHVEPRVRLRAPRASARCSPPPAGSRARAGATSRGARRPPGCRRPARNAGAVAVFSANSSSSPRSRVISRSRVRAAAP